MQRRLASISASVAPCYAYGSAQHWLAVPHAGQTRSWRPLNPATTPRPAASADVASVRPASHGADNNRRAAVTPHELDHRQPPLHREAQVLGQLLRPMPPARRTAIPRKRIARCEAALFHFTKGAWSTSKIRARDAMRMTTGTK